MKCLLKRMYFSSAPARVCLYGEHQDYLGLKVIPAAINLRFNVSSIICDTNYISVQSLDKDLIAKIPLDINWDRGIKI